VLAVFFPWLSVLVSCTGKLPVSARGDALEDVTLLSSETAAITTTAFSPG
jgi:hypothetical protein